MKISVIIPAYQCEGTIVRCLSSLFHQTYKPYEIIVVNDGSTDQTPHLLEELKKQMDNLKVIHQENLGAMDARLSGLNIVTGDYIVFLDSDDWLAKNALELLNEVATEQHSDIVLFHAYFVSGEMGYPIPLYNSTAKTVINCPLKAFFDRDIGGYICGKMVKRSFLQSHQIEFPHETSYGEDVAMFYSIFMNHPTVSCCNEYLYYYVKTNKAIPSYCIDLMKSIDFIGEELKKYQLYEEYEDDYQLLGTRYAIELYNEIKQNKPLQEQLFKLYQSWNQKYFGH